MNEHTSGLEKLYAAREVRSENRCLGLMQEKMILFNQTKDESMPLYNLSLGDLRLSSSFITIFFDYSFIAGIR